MCFIEGTDYLVIMGGKSMCNIEVDSYGVAAYPTIFANGTSILLIFNTFTRTFINNFNAASNHHSSVTSDGLNLFATTARNCLNLKAKPYIFSFTLSYPQLYYSRDRHALVIHSSREFNAASFYDTNSDHYRNAKLTTLQFGVPTNADSKKSQQAQQDLLHELERPVSYRKAVRLLQYFNSNHLQTMTRLCNTTIII